MHPQHTLRLHRLQLGGVQRFAQSDRDLVGKHQLGRDELRDSAFDVVLEARYRDYAFDREVDVGAVEEEDLKAADQRELRHERFEDEPEVGRQLEVVYAALGAVHGEVDVAVAVVAGKAADVVGVSEGGGGTYKTSKSMTISFLVVFRS